jgi:hypothetical protein
VTAISNFTISDSDKNGNSAFSRILAGRLNRYVVIGSLSIFGTLLIEYGGGKGTECLQ